MGMFDRVHFEMECPRCGEKMDEFQSKSWFCTLEMVEPDVLSNFYDSCNKCGTRVEFSRGKPELLTLRETSLSVDEVEKMGFIMKTEGYLRKYDENVVEMVKAKKG